MAGRALNRSNAKKSMAFCGALFTTLSRLPCASHKPLTLTQAHQEPARHLWPASSSSSEARAFYATALAFQAPCLVSKAVNNGSIWASAKRYILHAKRDFPPYRARASRRAQASREMRLRGRAPPSSPPLPAGAASPAARWPCAKLRPPPPPPPGAATGSPAIML